MSSQGCRGRGQNLPTGTVSCGTLLAQGKGLILVCTKESSSGQGFPARLPWGTQCSSQGAGMSLSEADTLLLFQHPIISPFNRNPSLSLKITGYRSHIFNWSTGLGVLLSYYCSGHRSVTDKHLGVMHIFFFEFPSNFFTSVLFYLRNLFF